MDLGILLASLFEYYRERKEKPLEKLREIGLGEGMTFLDIGCALGFYSFPASGIVGENGLVIALDINPKLVDYVANKSRKRGIVNIKALAADARETGLPSESVDVVFLHLVLHDIDDKREATREFQRVLRKNGRLVVDEENVMRPDEVRGIAEGSGFKFIKVLGKSTQIFENT